MNENFTRALADVLLSEGGYVNHPSDPGGPTNQGITLATFRKWIKRDGTVHDLKAITREQVAKVYRSVYWNAVRADDLPGGVDYAAFDYAVNSGPSRAAKALQTVLGVTADGVVGPATIQAAKAADPVAVVTKLCDQRLAFLKSLKTWPTFGKGWSNRIMAVREDALQLVGRKPATPVPGIPAPTPAPMPASPPVVKRWSLLGAILSFILSLFAKGKSK